MTLNLEGYDRNVNITGNTIQDILMSYGRSACPNLKSFYKKASNSNKTKSPTSFIPTYIFCMARVWLPWGFTTLTKKREASACWWNFTFCDIFISEQSTGHVAKHSSNVGVFQSFIHLQTINSFKWLLSTSVLPNTIRESWSIAPAYHLSSVPVF